MANFNMGVHMLPTANSSFDLGSSEKHWDDLYVDRINGKTANDLPEKKRFTVTIPTSGWTLSGGLYHVSVTVTGVLAADEGGGCAPVQTGTESTDKNIRKAWNKVTRITTAAGSITVYATEVPSVQIPILLEVFR